MKLLQDILFRVEILEVAGSTHAAIPNVCFDSRKVTKDALFVAVKGTLSDGHDYIDQAIEKGAAAILAEELPLTKPDGITYIRVKDSSKALGLIASNFYDNPSDKIKLVAVTGTNGKTSIVSLLHQFYQSLGIKSGVLSTIVNKIGFNEIPSTHTTPDALSINKLLSEMVNEDCKFCFMEASSHAIHQNRISGLHFNGAVFTNISHDHLDYHKTFDDYILAKKALFDQLPVDAFALVNKDDRHGLNMLHHSDAKKYTYALKSSADFKAKIIEHQFDGMLLNIEGKEVWTKLIGEFNAYNLLAIYATAILLAEDDLQALTSLSVLNSAEGRFEVCRSDDGCIGIVDYAHTPDALLNVIRTINDIKNEQQLITVFGCGGDRDKTKRSKMGQIASELSDRIIITSDNPRTEKPEAIMKDIAQGIEAKNLKKVLTISDRKEAIKTACSLASEGDVILIAGKGHEKYQEVDGEKFPFDDKEELKHTFNLLRK
jgi:UDP-N-acetylmuramoyl-L-alanyl-D-glutamate--2,6-diaminopimelate ligase